MLITSRANQRLKQARLLLRRKGRLRAGKWLVEGVRSLEEVLRHGLLPETLFYTEAAHAGERVRHLIHRVEAAGAVAARVSDDMMEELTDAQTPQGVTGVVPAPSLQADVFTPDIDWWLILDRIQDPGNLGTILRTALAAGVQGTVLLQGTADPGNPKAIRASAGAAFGMRLSSLNQGELLTTIERHGIRLITADLGATRSLYDVSWLGRVALVVGNEANGPDPVLVRASHEHILIPMPGPVESLNVSVAAALCLYEGVRQRSGSNGG